MIRKIVLTTVILGLVLGSLSCGYGTDQQASLSISGKYNHIDHPGEYLELKKDGSFYMWTGTGYSGEWEQDGNVIVLSGFAFGMAAKFRIDGDTLSDEYGGKWVKEKEKATNPAKRLNASWIHSNSNGYLCGGSCLFRLS